MIGILNIKDDLRKELSDLGTFYDLASADPEDLKGMYIDWVPKYHSLFLKQAEIIEKWVKKKIPIVIFDRYFSLTWKEFSWLNRFNVFFFEPAVSYRRGFDFMPQWISDRNVSQNEKSINLGYKDIINDRIASFEKYFLKYSSLYPNKKVFYNGDISLLKKGSYQDVCDMQYSDFDWKDVGYTILLGSKNEYKIGHLRDDLFEIMNEGCLPLLPIEHRFFGSAFRQLTVKTAEEVDYFVSLFDNVKESVIEDLFGDIEKYYPEFSIEYTAERIRSCLL